MLKFGTGRLLKLIDFAHPTKVNNGYICTKCLKSFLNIRSFNTTPVHFKVKHPENLKDLKAAKRTKLKMSELKKLIALAGPEKYKLIGETIFNKCFRVIYILAFIK